MIPTLYIIVPCYNEEKVLPVTSRMFSEKIGALIGNGKISEASKVLFVNDGSRDNTWKIITELTCTFPEQRAPECSLGRTYGGEAVCGYYNQY